MKTCNVVAVLMCAGVSIASALAGGCASGGTLTDPAVSATWPTTVESSMTVTSSAATSSMRDTNVDAPSSSTSSSALTPQSDVARLFSDLARAMAPLPVYGPDELPSQAALPAQWWPALSAGSPSDYHGPETPNPWISESPPGTQEAQVLLKLGDGWLVIIENFRGDLGDVAGSAVGTVSGRPAMVYELDDGFLVQWSDQGVWYGVFGRGVSADDVVRAALALTVI